MLPPSSLRWSRPGPRPLHGQRRWSYGGSGNSGRKDQTVDEQRFDTWTRVFARSGSRRRLVRALVGSGVVLAGARHTRSDAAAHHASAGPGDPCRKTSQCLGADAPLVCDWNGYGNACCTYEGNRCGFDAACCGTALCIGGYCSSGSPSSCTGVGCACMTGTFSPCDYGLECCAITRAWPAVPAFASMAVERLVAQACPSVCRKP